MSDLSFEQARGEFLVEAPEGINTNSGRGFLAEWLEIFVSLRK